MPRFENSNDADRYHEHLDQEKEQEQEQSCQCGVREHRSGRFYVTNTCAACAVLKEVEWCTCEWRTLRSGHAHRIRACFYCQEDTLRVKKAAEEKEQRAAVIREFREETSYIMQEMDAIASIVDGDRIQRVGDLFTFLSTNERAYQLIWRVPKIREIIYNKAGEFLNDPVAEPIWSQLYGARLLFTCL
jgi:hypothetical protein